MKEKILSNLDWMVANHPEFLCAVIGVIVIIILALMFIDKRMEIAAIQELRKTGVPILIPNNGEWIPYNIQTELATFKASNGRTVHYKKVILN